jgi:hypothetical protein
VVPAGAAGLRPAPGPVLVVRSRTPGGGPPAELDLTAETVRVDCPSDDLLAHPRSRDATLEFLPPAVPFAVPRNNAARRPQAR